MTDGQPNHAESCPNRPATRPGELSGSFMPIGLLTSLIHEQTVTVGAMISFAVVLLGLSVPLRALTHRAPFRTRVVSGALALALLPSVVWFVLDAVGVGCVAWDPTRLPLGAWIAIAWVGLLFWERSKAVTPVV